MQDLWQLHYQILSVIFLKIFIELNLISDTIIKNVNHVELNISIATAFFEYTNLKDDLIKCKCLCCKRKLSTQVWWKVKRSFLIHANFLTTTIIICFTVAKRLFILMNFFIYTYLWLLKIQYTFITFKKKNLQSLTYGRYYWCRLCPRKEFVKILE